MSTDTDWLDAEETPSRKAVGKPRRASKKRRPVALIRAERTMNLEHRCYLNLLAESLTFLEAEKRLVATGYKKRDRATYWRWRQQPDFAEALGLLQDWQFQCSQVSKARLMSDAEKIKQHALTPQPILYKGKATKHKEIDLGAAMRAIEFQGKGLGITDPDQRGVKVNIDIDFSGRAAGVTIEAEDGEFEETLAVD